MSCLCLWANCLSIFEAVCYSNLLVWTFCFYVGKLCWYGGFVGGCHCLSTRRCSATGPVMNESDYQGMYQATILCSSGWFWRNTPKGIRCTFLWGFHPLVMQGDRHPSILYSLVVRCFWLQAQPVHVCNKPLRSAWVFVRLSLLKPNGSKTRSYLHCMMQCLRP